MYGLRLIVDSSGIGRQISLVPLTETKWVGQSLHGVEQNRGVTSSQVPIVIQLGSCLALVQIACHSCIGKLRIVEFSLTHGMGAECGDTRSY